MKQINRRQFAIATAAMTALTSSFAQTGYPTRPVQLVHGFGAGGNADVVSRLIAQKLQDALKQPVVVDIKTGAGGSIATAYAAKATPDGHTLAMLTGAHTVSAALRKNLPFDAVKDFAFISTVSSFPFVVAVRAEHPAQNLKQLLEIAKKDRLTFTSVGVGSTQHMVGELLGASSGVPLEHIPYRGGGAPVQAVIAGDVDILTDTPTVALPHIQSGRLKALAVTSAEAWPFLPGVPTAATTVPGFEVRSWLGLAAPAGTPDSIIKRLNADLIQILRMPDVQKALGNSGSVPAPSSPAAMQQMVRTDIARWSDVIARRGIKVD
jgi:tripartite-type tricarboxylate transporter receptor subunit TctC